MRLEVPHLVSCPRLIPKNGLPSQLGADCSHAIHKVVENLTSSTVNMHQMHHIHPYNSIYIIYTSKQQCSATCHILLMQIKATTSLVLAKPMVFLQL